MTSPTASTKSASNCDETRFASWVSQWAQTLRGGEIVLLEGPLGAGKTTWVRHALTARGWTFRVGSPTFPLVQHFDAGGIHWVHVDLYRLDVSQDSADLDDQLDFREFLGAPNCVTLMEWSSQCPEFKASLLRRAHQAGTRLIEVHIRFSNDPSKRDLTCWDVV